jgi:predicted pyridoxine 5'-phosphate oxidase superfamily flavin-nucleotide-binding protein
MASRRSIDYSFSCNNLLYLTGIIVAGDRPYISAMNETPNTTTNGWHAGEREAQRRAGVAEKLAAHGPRVLRPFMTDQHRQFFDQLPFLVVGSVDGQGRPWASLLSGYPGFAGSPDPTTLLVSALPCPGDPLAEALRPGAALGILGIELPTRRRNRVNGRVASVTADGFSLAVDQSFGNCPQYIHARDYVRWAADGPASLRAVEALAKPDDEARALIARADTLFLASAAAPAADGRFSAVDASHRGGLPGFLNLAGDGAIELPDYRGNFYFNSVGNLMTHPFIGLLIADFDSRDLLQLAGSAEVIWDGEALERHPGAQRLIRIRDVSGRWLRRGFPLDMAAPELSPQAIAAAGSNPR